MKIRLIGRILRIGVLSILLPALLLCISVSAKAVTSGDELKFLSGVLVDINYEAKRIVVDVKTLGCEGRKTFTADDMSKFPGKEGERIDFYVDTAYCPGSYGSKMLLPRRAR